MKEQLPDLFSAWLLCLDPQDRASSPTGCRPHCQRGQQHLPHPPTARCNQELLLSKGSISTEDIFLFVCYQTYSFPLVQTILQHCRMGRVECQCGVQLEVTQHAVVQ